MPVAGDQLKSATGRLLVYGYDADSRLFAPSASDIYPIEICFLEDEFTARKRSDVSKTEFESLVTRILPDALLSWYNQSDLCSVMSENDNLDSVIDILLENDIVLFAQKMICKFFVFNLTFVHCAIIQIVLHIEPPDCDDLSLIIL